MSASSSSGSPPATTASAGVPALLGWWGGWGGGGGVWGPAAGNHRIGGFASFIGLVRDMGGGERVSALTLEHYPGMTEKRLAEIETEAHRRWPLDAGLRIHRFGRLEPSDRIWIVP